MNKMDNTKFTKVKDLINKLLRVTVENGATEAEAISAALKVQRILAKYDMEISEIEKESEDVVNVELESSNDVWRFGLASVIASNFCIEVYCRNKTLLFYGYKRHCETAKSVFNTMYNFGRKRASEIFKEYRSKGYNVNGIKNQFYIGFVDGIESALNAQSRALMIITPPEVTQKFNEFMMEKGSTPQKTSMTYRKSVDIYNKGVQEGRAVATRKEVEMSY